MCGVINRKASQVSKAYWRKGNEPEGAYWFSVVAAPCLCGKTWWVRPKEMLGWVEAVPENEFQT